MLVDRLRFKIFGGSHLVAAGPGLHGPSRYIRLFKEMTAIENLLVAQHMALDRNVAGGLHTNNKLQILGAPRR